jgi:cysteine-rich repeat protein
MRVAYAWGFACLLVLAGLGCSVRDRTGLKIASATPRDAGARGGACDAAAGCDDDDAGPVASAAQSCQHGACWWSREGDGCNSVGMPGSADRPAPANASEDEVPDFYLGLTHMRLGETDEKGAMDREAWQRFGFDLDGVCSNTAGCLAARERLSCKPLSQQTSFDGVGCRDNTFASLMPVAAAVPEIGERFGLSELVYNCNLRRGTYNIVLKVSHYNGTANDADVRADFYTSPGMVRLSPWDCPDPDFEMRYPPWRASTQFKVDPDNLLGEVEEVGKLPDSKVADGEAYVRDGYLVMHFPDDMLLRFAQDGADGFRGFAVQASQNVWTGRLERAQTGVWTLRDGIFAGRMGSDDLILAFRRIGLCKGTGIDGFYDSVVEWVQQSADVLLDGTNDEERACDAVSFGIGFEASQLTVGPAEKSVELVECCDPGVAIEDCSSECGDGKRTAKETCDTAIAAGMPDACPTECPAIAECAPRVLDGVGCQAQCKLVDLPIGAADGCCPLGADATTDADCVAVCGNNVVERDETCDPPGSCPVCVVADQCLILSSQGSAQSCNISCTVSQVLDCVSGDGCCGADCSASEDSDCSTTCGNGTVEAAETCDGSGSRACPEDCNDDAPCTTDYMSGSVDHCNIVCTHVPVTQPRSGDECCPTGASANTDADCEAECGNRSVETGEDCDDGNADSGDGCTPDCRAEDPKEQCLASLEGDRKPECAACGCEKCQDLVLDCFVSDSAEDAALCSALVECGMEKQCASETCFCGSAPLSTCLFGMANGPCKAEVEAAGRSTFPGDLVTRSTDTNYPAGRANTLAACMRDNCPAECEIPSE